MGRGEGRESGASRRADWIALVVLVSLIALFPLAISWAATNLVGGLDGSFESGLGGASTEGDVSVVSSFGILLPTEGNRALLMTTEPDGGSGQGDATLSRLEIANFSIPAEFAQLRVDYDFFTDEPLPSRTNDRFSAQLFLVTSGGDETLLQVDTFDTFYPTVFSSYSSHTGLRTMYADVSGHAASGEELTLELRIEDVGDGRGSSAVFLDNLRLVEPGTPVAQPGFTYLAVEPNDVIHFDGSGSADDGAIVQYEWDFANGFGGFGPFVDLAYTGEGAYQGTLTVTDDEGHSDTSAFTVMVGEPGQDPSIVSTPPLVVRENLRYAYQVEADDPELAYGDVLIFSLPLAPTGMTIDPTSGLVYWTPPAGAAASNGVTVRVEDSFGGFDEQSFTLTSDPSTFIVAADDAGRVYYAKSNGDGTWSDYRQEAVLSGVIRGIAIADFDNDGDWDFVVPSVRTGNTLDLVVFVNDGADQFTQRLLGGVANAGSGRAYGMTAGDYDADGNMDVVISRDGVNIVVGRGDGTGRFAVSEFSSALGNGRGMDSADFDHDGHLDFVRARYSNGEVHLWAGDGSGSFANQGVVADPGVDPYGVTAADFDGDGHTDILTAYGSNGDSYFYAGVGDGTFAAPVYEPSADFGNYGSFDNYDFDRDGNQDLITVSYTTRIIRYYPGLGDGTFGAEVRVNPSNTGSNILGVSAPPGPPPVGDPIALIDPAFTLAGLGATVDLSGAGSSDDGVLVSFDWDFGDGDTDSGEAVSHTFPGVEDDYHVRLTIADDDGRKAVGPALVRIAGAPPIADAGGPYVFGEEFANAGAFTVSLSGLGSSDDGPAPPDLDWDLGDGVLGGLLDEIPTPGGWLQVGATTDGTGRAIVTGAGGWGSRYLFTARQYDRRGGNESYRGRVLARSGGTTYAMWGLKNTGTNYSYSQMPYAVYFNQGSILIYEGGSNRGTFAAYAADVSYDVRIDVKPSQGATYYLRETGTEPWTVLYDSDYSAATAFLFGMTVHSGIVEMSGFDTPSQTSAADEPSVTYPGRGTYDVSLTATDGVSQSDTDETTVSLVRGAVPMAEAGDPLVLTELDANCGQYTGSFSGSASTDDHGIYSYRWDFGDSQGQSGETLSHTYASAGSYTATLTVTDHVLQSDSDTVEVSTEVQDPPVADPGGPYAVDESAASAGMWTASFSGAGSTDDFGICDYSWDFGDGGTATVVAPTHQYVAAGVYTVTLTVRDHALQSHTLSTTIDVSVNDPPAADSGGPYAVDENQALRGQWTADFDATGSTDDFGIWKYDWDFGDGGTGTGATPTHVYALPGTYDVGVTITDNGRQTHTVQTQIVVAGNDPPVADAGPARVAEVGQPVILDASGSTDDFEIWKYAWDFDFPILDVDDFSGGAIDPSTWIASSNAVVVAGEAEVTGQGNWGTQYLLTQEAFARGAGLSVEGRMSMTGPANQYVMWGLKNTGTNYSYTQFYYAIYFTNGLIYVYESGSSRGQKGTYTAGVDYDLRIETKYSAGATYWVRESGTSDWTLLYTSTYSSATPMRLGVTVHSGTAQLDDFTAEVSQANHLAISTVTYESAGTFQPEVTVTDHAQQTDTDGTVVTIVLGDPPAADTGGPYITNEMVPTRVNARGSTDDFGIEWYAWDFGDGTTLDSRNPFADHIYTGEGSYDVVLTVTDYAGQSSSQLSTVTVLPDPVVAAVPWAFSGGIEIPHDTWGGKEIILKAVTWSNRTPLTYEWDFGDGSAPATGTVGSTYGVQAKHTYTGVEGQPFVATVTITDVDGRTAQDDYLVRIRAKSLDIETNVAIDNGLWYLHNVQARSEDAGILLGSWKYSSYYAHSTASSVQALLINGHSELGDVREDPYVETVSRGLHYLFRLLATTTIGAQSLGDPDANANGLGLTVTGSRPIYEGGPVMDAIASTASPDVYADTGVAGVVDRTYRDIAQEMVDQFSWGQYDAVQGGGWRYGWNSFPDNSAAQWGAIGELALQQNFGVGFPEWVETANNVWLNYSFNGAGFGYTGPGNGQAQTPSGMIQMVMDGFERSDPRWVASENTIANNWYAWYRGNNNYYALFALTKTMRLALPTPIETLQSTGAQDGLDWFSDPVDGLARTLIDDAFASTDGSFAGGGSWVNQPTRSAWGVIMLTRALFVQPPVADAGPDRVWGVDVPLTLDGSGSFHVDPFRDIVNYEWDLDGDGVFDTSSADPTAVHTYTSTDYPEATLPRNITVTLRVRDNNDPAIFDTDSAVITIAVPPHPPVADAGGPYNATAGVPLQLDGSGSFDIDPTDFITAWEWDLDSDGEYDDATGEQPSVTFDQPGQKNVGLRVWDNGVLNPDDLDEDGKPDKLPGFDFTTVIVEVNVGPVAEVDGPHVVDEGSSVDVDAGASFDANDDSLAYAWDLDDDSVFDDATGPVVPFAGIDDGIYPVAVQVTDSLLTSEASTTVTVNNLPPVVTLPATASVNVGTDFSLGTVGFTDAGIADTHIASVDWGDGSSEALAVSQGAGSGSVSGSHGYPTPGVRIVTLSITDDDDGVGQASIEVTVNNLPPVVDAGAGLAGGVGTPIALDGAAFTDTGLLDTHTASIDWGDGTVTPAVVTQGAGSGTVAASHSYATADVFVATLTVTDNHGASGQDTVTINTINPNLPPTAIILATSPVDEGVDVPLDGTTSFDPEGESLTYEWDLDDDGQFDDGVGATATLPMQDDGSYPVSLRVFDGEFFDQTTVVIQVQNVPPEVGATGPSDGSVGEDLTYTGSFTDPGPFDTHTWQWNFGDGSPTVDGAGPDVDPATHAYSAPGTYTVTLTVTDDDGGVGSASVVTRVGEPLACPILDSDVHRGNVQLTWNSIGADTTNIYRSDLSGGPYTFVGATASAYGAYYDDTVEPGQTYFYVVRPMIGGDEFCQTNQVTETPGVPLPPRIDDLVARHKDGSVTLEWTALAEATAYNLYRRVPGGVFALIEGGIDPATALYVDLGVQNGTTYEYSLRWLDGQGAESADSTIPSSSPTAGGARGAPAPEMPPQLLSPPVVTATPGAPYSYTPAVSDPDAGDAQSYTLPTAPAGMTIDSASGLIEWTPAVGQSGEVEVQVRSDDGQGHFVTQRWWIRFPEAPNVAPAIVSAPVLNALVGLLYVYDVDADDANAGDLMEFELLAAPAEMRIDARTGLIDWTPAAGDAGTAGVTVRVLDNEGLEDSQSFDIVVGAP